MSEVRVLILIENGIFVAQCLEFDVAAQGSSVEEALNRFDRMLCGAIIVGSGRKAAPAYYLDLWNKAYHFRDQHTFPDKMKEEINLSCANLAFYGNVLTS